MGDIAWIFVQLKDKTPFNQCNNKRPTAKYYFKLTAFSSFIYYREILHNASQPTSHFTVMLSAIIFLHMSEQQQSSQILTIM